MHTHQTLAIDEPTTTEHAECGCLLTRTRANRVVHRFCPMHQAAPQLLEALEEAQAALVSAILFIEGAFTIPRGDILQHELTSYHAREIKARAAIQAAKETA